MSSPQSTVRRARVAVPRALVLITGALLLVVSSAGAKSSSLDLRQPLAAGIARNAPGLRSTAPSPQALAASVKQTTGLSASQVTAVNVCPAPSPKVAECAAQALVLRSDHARVHPHIRAGATFTQVFPRHRAGAAVAPAILSTSPASSGATPPASGTPAFLQQAYDLTYLSQTAGGSDTVAIVDAYNDPTAESDLATFRSTYGLSACTTANGCFRKVNQAGTASPLPSANSGWEQEESLDLDAVSSLCPNCHILLVEATTSFTTDLNTAIATAQSLGANQISNSWGATSSSPFGASSFPGASIIAATGDHGYPGAGVNEYPAAFAGVTAAGGTTLTAATGTARGYGESAWSLSSGWGGTSGCDLSQTKPAYQADTGCTGRSYSDVSADANPNTGLGVYDSGSGGWLLMGGTSLSSPLVAAYEAITGINGTSPQWAYTNSTLLNDPATGSSGTCAQAILYICNAGTGYDGPTGIGSISGAVATGAPGVGGPAGSSSNSYTLTIAANSAALTGGVYPNGHDTTAFWQYGATANYGQQTAATDVGSGTAPVRAPGTLSGLAPSTSYHYRLVAQNSTGTTYGYDYSLTTAAAGSVPPANTAPPAITGTVQQGQTLSASTGTWTAATTYAYQWQRSTTSGASWTDIGAATNSTYTPAAADLAVDLRVAVSAGNSFGTTTVTSSLVGPVASDAPVNTAAPAISGTPQQGLALTASTGTWSPAATAYADQWQRSTDGGQTWTSITGATSSSYTPGTADLNAEIEVTVTAGNAYGSASATSALAGPIASGAPVNTGAPTITGAPDQGQVLSVTSTWSPAGTTDTYQWQRSSDGFTWSPISGAAASTYTLVAADIGTEVSVTVTATNAYGQASGTSALIGPVLSSAPANLSPPTVTGTAQRTNTLTATQGWWSGAGVNYAYQWQRSADGSTWTSINGATTSTYTLGLADEGDDVRALVTATNAYGAVSEPSSATQLIAPYPPANTVAPTVTGTSERGYTLTATQGSWTGPDNVYAYQWQEDFGEGYVDISGATTASYGLNVSDEGAAVRVIVRVTNPDATIVQASPPTATVTSAIPVNHTAPNINGRAQRGSTLSAGNGVWDGLNNVYAIQWQRSGDGGTTWTNIAGQSGSTYTVPATDVGAVLRVQVTAANADGTVAAVSAPTATVTSSPPVAASAPTIAGNPLRGVTLSSTPGVWSGLGNVYVNQWQRSGDGISWTTIAGATSASYTLTLADEGDAVRLLVTATNPDGAVSRASQPTSTILAAPPANTTLPVVAGTPQRTIILSASVGAWSGIDNAYACQWQRSTDGGSTWTSISGATGWGYTVGVADEGARLRAVVTATNADGSAAVSTAPTAAAIGAPPTNSTPPAIAGAAVRGTTLTSSAGSWGGIGDTFVYQWQRSADAGTTWTNIAGAGSYTYTLAVADEGDTVRLLVTAINPDTSLAVGSAATATVTGSPPADTTAPTLSGNAWRGATLTSTTGSWSGLGDTYAYTWQRSSDGATWTAISGATGPAYTLGVADEGDAVRVLVSASNPDATVGATSTPTASVTATPPVNSTAPTVSGTPQRTAILSSTQGTWSGVGNAYTYQWQHSPDGTSWTDITGATSATYALGVADETTNLRLVVTAANADARVSAASAATPTVQAAAPVNTTAPVITGAALRGITLTGTPGIWSGIGNSIGYQWQRSTDGRTWTAIPGVTGTAYTLAVPDEGDTVRLLITVTNPDGTVSVPSAATATVLATAPANATAPTIAGAAQRGDSLTSTPGAWSGIGNTLAYQWQRSTGASGWTDIAGAVQTTYKLLVADEGATVRIRITATNPDGSSSTASAATATVTSTPPVNTQVPSITGTAQRTSTLTATSGSFNGIDDVYTYQWQRSADTGSTWSSIAGATGATYLLAVADEGDTVRVVVTAANPDGAATTPSAASATIQSAPPLNTRLPGISGTPRLAATLVSDNGAWNPAATSYTYQWQRGDATNGYQNISGATHSSYTLVAADIGETIRVIVSATNPDGSPSATSAPTAAVAPPPHNVTAPAVPSGTLMDNSVLTADHGSWDATATYAYQWLRCPAGATGPTAACNPVGAGATYTLVPGDVGNSIAVTVTATSVGGSASANSAATGTVIGRPLINTTPPSISGDPQPPQTLNANPGAWSVQLSGVAYIWERCDADGVSNCTQVATNTSHYTLSAADDGSTIVLIANVTSPGRTASAQSPALTVASQPLPQATVRPVVTGTPTRTNTLNATGGTWTNSPTSITYQWQRCDGSGHNCQSIAGATNTRYTLVQADEGSSITVQVTATNTTGSGVATALPTAVVAALPPVNTHIPVLSPANAQQGTAVAVTAVTWNTTSDTTFRTSWQRCDTAGASCQTITGATANAYVPGAADIGHTIIATVTATNTDAAVPAASAPSAVVIPAAPRWRDLPILDATNGNVGGVLSITPGVWTGPAVTSDATQVMRCTNICTAITSAGAYTIATADIGAILRLRETAGNAGGSTVVWSAQYVGPVSSLGSASTVLASGQAVLRNYKGTELAVAQVSSAASMTAFISVPGRAARRGAVTRRVTVRRARGMRGSLRAWVCPMSTNRGGAPLPCTRQVSLRVSAMFKLPASMTGRVRVVVVRKGR
jgi:hypothetical protein